MHLSFSLVRKKNLLFTLLLLLPFALVAQRAQFGAGFAIAYPLGEMNENYDAQWGYGLNLYLMGKLHEDVPLYLGADFTYALYDKFSESLPPTFPGEELEQVINSNIILGHAVLRVSPMEEISPVRLYVDGLIGGKYFYTRWKLNSTIGGDTQVLDASTDEANFAASYGLGVGLQIAFTDHFALDLRTLYLFGTETDYVQAVRRDPASGALTYEMARTETTMLLPQLGFTLLF